MSRRLLLTDPADPKHPSQSLRVLSEVTTGTSSAIQIGRAHRISVLLEFDDGTITDGVVRAESATSADYTGTWVNEGEIAATSNTQDRIGINGPIDFLRIDIPTAIVGGGKLTSALIVAYGK